MSEVQIDRRALNRAKQKDESYMLTMGEVCAVCQARLGISRTKYYNDVRPLIEDRFKYVDASGSTQRMKKEDLLEELKKIAEEGFPVY